METITILLTFFFGTSLGAWGGLEAARLTRSEREKALIRQIHALRAAQEIALTAWTARQAMAEEAKRLRKDQTR